MEDSENAESEEEKKVRKFKKTQDVMGKYTDATYTNSVMRSGGYDHSEGPDFDNQHDAIAALYKKKLKKADEGEKDEEAKEEQKPA